MKYLIAFFFGLSILVEFLPGQTMNTGTLLGTVRDPTGAAVPGAVVTVQRIIRLSPGVSRRTKTAITSLRRCLWERTS